MVVAGRRPPPPPPPPPPPHLLLPIPEVLGPIGHGDLTVAGGWCPVRSNGELGGSHLLYVPIQKEHATQAAVPVLPDDTAASLADRVLAAEHQLYPHALRLIAAGKVRVDGEIARVEQPAISSCLINPPLT